MSTRAASPTIATGLSLRNNSLNFLRVFGALLVIVSHSPHVTGLGEHPNIGTMELGVIPVTYFFVISGFLITGSRYKLNGPRFTARRLARIFPGWWLAVVITGLGLSAIAGHERGGWNLHRALLYIVRNLLFLPGQGGLGSTLHGSGDPSTWNGSVWTIPVELMCYFTIGCFLAVPYFRHRLKTWSIVACVLTIAVGEYIAQSNPEPGFLYLLAFFAAGVFLYAWQDRIPLNGRFALGALAITAVCFQVHQIVFLATIPYAYLILWFGAYAPQWMKNVGTKNDFSYGIYLYAWPVQQVLVAYHLQDHGLWVFNIVAMVCSFALAMVSWFLVEHPATEYARRVTATAKAPASRTDPGTAPA